MDQEATTRQGWWPARLARITRRLVLVAFLLVILVFFVADNFVIVEVRLFGIHQTMRLAWTILLAFAIGAAAGAALIAWRLRLWRR